MREWIAYLGEVILITAVSGMIWHLAPEGALKKHLHFVISLCVLISLAVPLFSVVRELPGIFEKSYEDIRAEEQPTEDQLLESVLSVSKKEIETAIVSYIAGKYDMLPEEITVSLTLDDSCPQSIEILAIDVSVITATSVQKSEIQKDLSEMFLGKTKITVY